MSRPSELDSTGDAIEALQDAGFEVKRDVHVHEEKIDGRTTSVADVTVLLEGETDD